MSASVAAAESVPLGIGYYTVPEAARLLGIRRLSIRRWLGGYTFTRTVSLDVCRRCGDLSFRNMTITLN